MMLTKIMLFHSALILCVWFTSATPVCQQRYTNRPLNGFRCNGPNYASPRSVTQGSCVHACMASRSCSTMSYNPVSNTCLLAGQPCVKAEKHDDFMLMIFREQENVDCSVWVRDQSGVVPARMLIGPDDAQVGRVTVGDELLVGQAYNPGQNWNTYIAKDGNQIYFPNEDFLTVHANCTMAWLPYTAGDSVPHKAVVTGMLADGRRLYSSLSWHTPCSCWRIGSYAEGDTAAYYAHSGSNAVTDFDILVEVWKADYCWQWFQRQQDLLSVCIESERQGVNEHISCCKCYRVVCKILKRSGIHIHQPYSFQTCRELAIRCCMRYWNANLLPISEGKSLYGEHISV